MAQATILIEGMSCAGCVASVTAVLNNTGVVPRAVAIGRATIEFENQAAMQQALAALDRQGFSAHVAAGGTSHGQ